LTDGYFPAFSAVGQALLVAGRWLSAAIPRAFLLGLVLLLIAAIPWFYYNIKWGRQLGAELGALKRQGMPLRMVDAVPGSVPDRENAAVEYQKVFRVNFSPGQPPVLTRGLAGLSKDELAVVREYIKGRDMQLEPQLRDALSRPQVRSALNVLRRGSERPHCAFPVHWEDRFGVLFNHMARFRAASGVLVAQSLLLAREGRPEQALDWCMVALRMSEHAAAEHKLDELTYLGYMGKLQELSHVPYRSAAAQLGAMNEEMDEVNTYMLAPHLCRMWRNRLRERHEAAAKVGLCRVALALKAHKHEHNAYPPTLEQLQEGLDYRLPEDPFSGTDFAYQPDGDGFKLYSLGGDLDDDDGASADDHGHYHGNCDIVWESAR